MDKIERKILLGSIWHQQGAQQTSYLLRFILSTLAINTFGQELGDVIPQSYPVEVFRDMGEGLCYADMAASGSGMEFGEQCGN